MNKIQVLDSVTIDKIAAGEVIERPASVVKELVENAIDAGSTAIVVEIKDGGISLIRITDNGSGIDREDVPAAFLRHSTSKIRTADDLVHIGSLGFRGEALSSIAAVSQVELITKTKEQTFGTRYRIAGGKEEELEDAGAPDGTTFLVRQLFYNTPARRKFLKTPMTEASHVGDLMTRMALSHPDISFQFINNGQSKLHTSGNGNLKDVIYHIYGRDIAANLLSADYEASGIKVTGYLGKPLISRGNRNFENYYINGRYVKSSIISKAIEDAYKDFTMQHKYPFVVLHMDIDGESVDVNVHPTKMELRFNRQQEVYNTVYAAVDQGLHEKELIPHVEIDVPTSKITPQTTDSLSQKNISQKAVEPQKESIPQNAVTPAKSAVPPVQERDLNYFMTKMKERVMAEHRQRTASEKPSDNSVREDKTSYRVSETPIPKARTLKIPLPEVPAPTIPVPEPSEPIQPKQLDLFEEKLLTKEAKAEYKIIGQVFETYWLVEYHDNLYIIDQHAAHERVLYEKTLRSMKTREYTSQMISPPIVLNLSMQEGELLNRYMDQFTRIGFEIEEFGQDSYAVRAVPDNLFSIAKKDLLLQMLDSLSDELNRNLSPELIDEKVASMSCKAAVKGNMKLSAAEVDTLIGELLTLDNPYHCPHGRPTIIAMTKRELEKKFKRII
ncbi:MAG: DNA mismatch repair endonuclease MutL [Dorea sp.]|nr:DNA mismatch repair endonuclease MutL [Dorea sp.]